MVAFAANQIPFDPYALAINVNHDEQNNAADSSFEENNEKKRPEFLKKLHNFLHENDAVNYFLGAGDVLSAATDFCKSFVPKPFKSIIDKGSVGLTKAAMMLRYLEAGIDALYENRLVEAIGRVLGIVALPGVKLYDLSLASGLGEFIPQLDLALEGKLGANKKYSSISENIKEWTSALTGSVKELIKGGLGKERKIFPDLNMAMIKKTISNLARMFLGKKFHAVESPNDKGHTLTLAGILTMLGSVLGLTLGSKSRGFWNKLSGVIRNTGSHMANYTLLTHKDEKMKKAGVIFSIADTVDLIQRFLPEWMINTINHLNIINIMLGQQIIAKRTRDKLENKVQTY